MQVPFITPITRVISLPASPSVRVLITGMPPATAASKRIERPLASASSARCLPVQGQHRLVGGDHVLAGAQRGLGGGLRRPVGAAHQLDEHIDVGARASATGSFSQA